MGADAKMALVLNKPWQKWQVDALSDRLFVMFREELFKAVLKNVSCLSWRAKNEKVEVWCDDADDIMHLSGDCILDVQLMCRFFDATYCRGPIGAIYMLAEYAEAATGCRVFYWTDEDGTGLFSEIALFDAAARRALLQKLAKEKIVRWGTDFAADVMLAPDKTTPMRACDDKDTETAKIARFASGYESMCPACGFAEDGGVKIGKDNCCAKCRALAAKHSVHD